MVCSPLSVICCQSVVSGVFSVVCCQSVVSGRLATDNCGLVNWLTGRPVNWQLITVNCGLSTSK